MIGACNIHLMINIHFRETIFFGQNQKDQHVWLGPATLPANHE
jgi:hypothetical protein